MNGSDVCDPKSATGRFVALWNVMRSVYVGDVDGERAVASYPPCGLSSEGMWADEMGNGGRIQQRTQKLDANIDLQPTDKHKGKPNERRRIDQMYQQNTSWLLVADNCLDVTSCQRHPSHLTRLVF